MTIQRSWSVPLLACVAAGLLLAVLSSGFFSRAQTDAATQADRERVNAALGKLAGLRDQPIPVCTPPSNGPTIPPSGRQGSAAPVQTGPTTPPPDRVEVTGRPGAGGAPTVQTLASLLDRATVLIERRRESGVSSGSGFFVSPTRILTNRHVVGDATEVKVSNRAMGRVVTARVVGVGTGSGTGHQDIALLEVPPQNDAASLRVGVTPERLTAVTAAGFPGVVLETLADRSVMPEATLTQGVVASRQTQQPDGIEAVFHTAVIAGGNSGGPLVDGGGCLTGMNSWGTMDVQQGVTRAIYSVAIDASELRRFLVGQGAAFTAADKPCVPIRVLGKGAEAKR